MPVDEKDANRGRGEISPEERNAFRKRASELGSRLDKVKTRQARDHGSAQPTPGIGQGMRMAADLVAAVLVGGLIGWALDRLLGTAPWLFIVMLLLGFVAGVRMLLKTYERMQAEIKRQTAGNIGQSVPDEDD
jgi:ATP synthase protein I